MDGAHALTPAAPPALRDYQQEALGAIRTFLGDGIWSQIMVLPTGAGKTFIFARLADALSDWLPQFDPARRKILVLAHRDELLQQAAAELQAANPELLIGIEAADARATWMHDIVVASVQTLTARGGRRLMQLDPDLFRIVVVDEAHHAAAPTYQMVLRYFNLLPPADLAGPHDGIAHARARAHAWWREYHPRRLLLGVTATPNRADAVGLEWTFRQIVYERSIQWMIERGYLAPPRGYLLQTDTDLDRVKWVAGDFQIGQLAAAVNTPERNRAIAHTWLERAGAEAPARGRQTIAFAVDVQHAKDLADAFHADGVPAAWVSGEAGSINNDRRATIDAYRHGAIDVLCNCQVLTEGFDHPPTACILLARPTASQTLYTQMIGRGLRPAPGKSDCIVLDVADVSRRHSLVSLGDLFGLPPGFNLQGAEAVTIARRVADLQQQIIGPLPQARTLQELERHVREIDLWRVKESVNVKQFGRLSWLEDTAERYHVLLPVQADDGALRSGLVGPQQRMELRQDLLCGWTIVRTSGPSIVEAIGQADDLKTAFYRAERWIEHHRPDVYRMKLRAAGWRRREISDKQLRALRRLRAPGDLEALTRGQAADLLDHYLANRK